MGYKLCPLCEINYIKDDEEACDICLNNQKSSSFRETLSGFNPEKGVLYPEKVHNKRFYFVFQGASYEEECSEGYIYAPKSGRHHWERLAELDIGDFIFHAAKGRIFAVSVAEGKGYDYKRSDYSGMGRRVDCIYCMLDRPLDTSIFRNEILTYTNQYSPFNKNGTGNQGYLFYINKILASIFLEEIMRTNPNIADIIKRLYEFK